MDAITPKERALIDQAIAAGRVIRVPTGMTSNPVNYVWADNELRPAEGQARDVWRKAREREWAAYQRRRKQKRRSPANV